ncbi:MAG: EF-P lysine aminoacylase GenX [Gammaproteobacteria bacterium AqS3]|nr:EF-P lysine aminoacylase GenX [Gammaproteobacteria bacterium AqS3]
MLRSVRAFFAERGVIEVATPVMGAHGNPDAEIDGIRTAAGAHLQTSPEFAMKRLLCAGSGDIFQIAPAFRSGESGRGHLPEFTLLEWYRIGFDEFDLIGEVEDLLAGLLDVQVRRRVRYAEAFAGALGCDPFSASGARLRDLLHERIAWRGAPPERRACQQILFAHCVEGGFAQDELTTVHHYPPEQAALARIDAVDGVRVARRFEVYCGGWELANGYFELADAEEHRRRFARDNMERRLRGEDPVEPQPEFLRALEDPGLPDCSGVALGLDRVLALQLHQSDLRSVVPTDED